MKQIVVPIKQVPETSNVKMDPENGTMIRKGLEAIINPLDLYALEAGLELKEDHGAKVTVITMGPNNAETALKEALALGCDDAILLSDREFRGADTWATSYTLSQAIRRLGNYDLIICGERATDGETGQVGPGIAAFLDLPLVTYVRKLYDIKENSISIERLVEEGIEIFHSNLPMVITVVKEIATPRLPTLRGMKKAKQIPIPIWGPTEIDANPNFIGLSGSPTRVVKIQKPKVSRNCVVKIGRTPKDFEEIADDLIHYLEKNELLS
jgi:electron transfer flavoprotein beta subunit